MIQEFIIRQAVMGSDLLLHEALGDVSCLAFQSNRYVFPVWTPMYKKWRKAPRFIASFHLNKEPKMCPAQSL